MLDTIVKREKTRNDKAVIKDLSHNLNDRRDLDPLLDMIGTSRCVLLGEASHGTHEYYTWRAEITRRLIEEKGFSFIAVEGDWPDCYRINQYVKGELGDVKTAGEVLRDFERWPTWMWSNWEIAALMEWLKNINDHLDPDEKIGFYGLDVYSLDESLKAIIKYLDKEDPEVAKTARKVVNCFDQYGGSEGQSYALATRMVPEACEEDVISMLSEITLKANRYDGNKELVLSTEQNANIAVNAEKYYRAMVGSGPASWNIRDHHMADTLERLMNFHNDAKCIVWEHNTHIGDARATSMAARGMVNLGQIAREKYGNDDVVLVGFGSYEGEVIAGNSWGAPMRRMPVPKAKKESWEYLLHQLDAKDRLLVFKRNNKSIPLSKKYGHRAIGVVYDPDSDHYHNYVASDITKRYDAFIYLDKTSALHPLHIEPEGLKMPETYPWGM